MLFKLSVVIVILSFCGVFGASLSVNVTDSHQISAENSTRLENSTKALNESLGHKDRDVDVELKTLSSNASNPELNLTANLTSSPSNATLMNERDTPEKETLEITPEKNATTKSTNSTGLNETDVAKAERADELSAGNTTSLNATLESTSNHTQAMREISFNATGSDNATTANNKTENVWSALPLFRNMSNLRNLTEATNSTLLTPRGLKSVENTTTTLANGNKTESEVSEESSTETSDSSKFDWLEDFDKKLTADDSVTTKKPCSTLACLVSRGCSDPADESCTSDN